VPDDAVGDRAVGAQAPLDLSDLDDADLDVGLLRPASAGTAAARLTGDRAVLQAMLDVEAAWAEVLDAAGVVPAGTGAAVRSHAHAAGYDVAALARAGVAGGNPVIPLVSELRRRVGAASSSYGARWVHATLTSQDVVDTALVLVAAAVGSRAVADLRRAAAALVRLSEQHRDTLAVARSLTQPALPTTVGLRVAGWLGTVTTAGKSLEGYLRTLPLQSGGAAGTLAALVELCAVAEADVRPSDLLADLAARLGLAPGPGWQTNRLVTTGLGAVLADVVAAAGHVAADTLTLGRPEIGEVTEHRPGGPGGSSAMPHKRNPVLGVLLRSLAIESPHLQAQLLTAAGLAVDERSDGAWHAEWPALRGLLRNAGAAAQLLADLAEGLVVHPDRARANLDAAGDALLGERLVLRLGDRVPGGAAAVRTLVADAVRDGIPLATAVRSGVGDDVVPDDELRALLDPAGYLGDAERLRRAQVERAERWLGR
jgi:3-carboxy-cis,cis-muconate cycloisomerase